MTTADVGVRPAPELVTADCPTCGLHVEQAADGDPAPLMRVFRLHHPLDQALPHTGLVPDGWRVPWSSPGSWSN